MIDLTSISLNLTTLIFIILKVFFAYAWAEAYAFKLGAIATIILWLKLFYFLRIFETTSPLIRMITQIIIDIQVFLIVLILAVVAFANGFYLLSINRMPKA